MPRVLIVEDESLFRDMLKISLGAIENLNVVDAVPDGAAAVDAADRLLPDVVLMDIELGGEPDGISAGRAIKDDHPEIGIVILSAHKEREYMNLVGTQEISGWSYLLKQSVTDAEARTRAIEGTAAGFVVMDPAVMDDMRPRGGSDTAGLTPRKQ